MTIDQKILHIDKAIRENIEILASVNRALLSQNILSFLRNLVEHVMLKIWSHPNDVDNTYANIQSAIAHVKGKAQLNFLRKFHEFLKISTSHYTLDGGSSERLMLKYYEHLLKLKKFLREEYSLFILEKLNQFEVDTDPGFDEYHQKIARKLDDLVDEQTRPVVSKDRYYIVRVHPFLVNERIFYEITFSPMA